MTLDGEMKTFESTRDQLEDIERQLAGRHNIRRQVRPTLIAMDRAGELPEDELVADWHDVYASYLNYARVRARAEEMPPPEPPRRETRRGECTEAAQAAFALLWGHFRTSLPTVCRGCRFYRDSSDFAIAFCLA
jgi:hypothetical protein